MLSSKAHSATSGASTAWLAMPAAAPPRAFEQVTDEEWQADLDLKLFAAIP